MREVDGWQFVEAVWTMTDCHQKIVDWTFVGFVWIRLNVPWFGIECDFVVGSF